VSALFDGRAGAEFADSSVRFVSPEGMGTVRHCSLVANFPQMNFTQMHERLRQELLRRIKRGTASVSLLARQTGLAQSHVSHFLRSKRQFSLDALDRVLAAQHLSMAELLPWDRQAAKAGDEKEKSAVPIVSHGAALSEPLIRASAAQSMLYVPSGLLESLRPRASSPRRAWQRFVAVCIEATDALPMEPLVLPDAIALIDRHYNSLAPYRANRLNLYAVRSGTRLTVRYVDFLAGRLLLRPHNLAFPVDLIEVDPDEPPNELLIGRVVLTVNEV
jgi:transcriptional regulator with XRE-family HTH domain